MKCWYKVTVYRAHRGSGRNESVETYIYAESTIEVLERYRTMPGVKRSPGMHHNFPDISPLTQDESLKLENRIIDDGRIPLNKAKRTWYYSEWYYSELI